MRNPPFYLLIAYIKYLFRAKNAHGVHSPFVYNIYQLIRKSSRFRIEEVEKLRKQLFKKHELLDVLDFKTKSSQRKTVSFIAKSSTSQPKFSAFLHLLINQLNVASVLETGTSLGINTSYLAFSKAEKIITIEGSTILSRLASRHFEQLSLDSVIQLNEELKHSFSQALIKHQPEFIFLDADHRGETTLNLLDQILELVPGIKCIVIHDIYWSKDMTEAWHQISKKLSIKLTVDIFQAGLLFPQIEMPKQHFILRF